MNKNNAKTGLKALLRPEDSILVLIDNQHYQFATLNSHEPTMIVNNVIGLAKTAKVFNVPTILTTVIEDRRHVEDFGRFGEADDIVDDHRRLVAVQVGELVRLMVDQHEDAVFGAKQGFETGLSVVCIHNSNLFVFHDPTAENTADAVRLPNALFLSSLTR